MKVINFTATVLTLISSCAFAMPSLDEEFKCIDSKEADQLVQDFNIEVKNFGGLELCNNNIDAKKLFNDLEIIKGGQFQNGNSNNLIRGFVPQDQYFSWLKQQTRGIDRGNDIPFATAYNRGGYFTMQDGWALLSTLGRVGTVVHEARHTQGYVHIQCTFGPYAGANVDGCDREYAYAGSHAIEMEYYARVSEMGSNYHPAFRSMARLMAMARANFVFNKSPLVKKFSLMAVDDANKVYYFDQKQVLERESSRVTPLLVKATSFGASIFDGLQFLAMDIYRDSNHGKLISDDYSYYKLLKQDRGQGPISALHDFEEVDQAQKRYFIYLNKLGKMVSYNYPKGQWGLTANVNLKNLDEVRFLTTLPDSTEGLFLQNGIEILQVNPETMKLSPLKLQFPVDIVKFASIEKSLYALTSDGKLKLSIGNQLTPVPSFDHLNIKHIVRTPDYDSFEVR